MSAISAISKAAGRRNFAALQTVILNERCRRFRRSPYPPPGLFSSFVANKALSSIRPLGGPCGPLGDPWATHGPPKGHPNPIPNPSIGRGSQRVKAARRNDRRASNCHRSLPMAEGQSPERSRRGAVQPGSPASAFFACWGEVAGSRTI